MKPYYQAKQEFEREYWAAADWTKPNTLIANEAGVNDLTVIAWRTALNKPKNPRKPRDPKPKEERRQEWQTWDWSKLNSQIARQHGIGRERVRQIRRLLDKPNPNPELRRPVSALIEAKINEFVHLTSREAAKAIGCTRDQLLNAARPLGIRFAKQGSNPTERPEWAIMNWRLPNRDLEKVWGLTFGRVASKRNRSSKPPPVYDIRFGKQISDPKYAEELEAEKAKAAEFKQRANGCAQPVN
jgi:hypothetical protein